MAQGARNLSITSIECKAGCEQMTASGESCFPSPAELLLKHDEAKPTAELATQLKQPQTVFG